MGYNPDHEDLEDKHFLELDQSQIKGASLNRNLLMVIVGDNSNASYLIYKAMMKNLANQFFIRNSFLYFASMTPLDPRGWKAKEDIEKLPAMLIFFQGKMVAEITNLPGKYMAKHFLFQVGLQAVLRNLEGRAGKLFFSKLNYQEKFEGRFCFLWSCSSLIYFGRIFE